MERLTIDSSVFISALNIKDKFHRQSRKFFAALEEMEVEIIIPATVILEVFNILLKAGKKKAAEEAVSTLLDFTVVEIDSDFLIDALPNFEKFALKTADATIAVTSLYYQTILVSWDRRPIKEVKKVHQALSPAEFLASL